MTDPTLVLVCTLVALVGVPGILLHTGGRWRELWPDLAALTALWALVGLATALTGVFIPGFAMLVAAIGIVMGAGVSAALAERVERRNIRMLLLTGFSLLVFLPLAFVVFGGNGTWLYDDFGALDFAGAVPLAIGTGSLTMVLAILGGQRRDTERVLAVRGALLFAIAAVGAAVGFELRVDELTPAIALNMLMTPAIAMLAAAGIERVKRGRNTREGLAAGIVAGAAAALAACAYLETATALMLGLLVGAVAEVAHRGASAAWRLATPLLIGGATGLLYLGLFGLGPGFVYSGQPLLLLQQVILVGAAIGWSWLISALLLLPLRVRRSRRPA